MMRRSAEERARLKTLVLGDQVEATPASIGVPA
jgi:hypothetical protein